jgi:hypothetical protein
LYGELACVRRAQVRARFLPVLVAERGGCARGSLAGMDAGEIRAGWGFCEDAGVATRTGSGP